MPADFPTASALQLFGVLIAALATIAAPTIAGIVIANRNAKLAREATKQVAEQLVESDKRIHAKLEQIERNSDGNLHEAQELIRALERRLFEATGEIPPDIASPKKDDSPKGSSEHREV